MDSNSTCVLNTLPLNLKDVERQTVLWVHRLQEYSFTPENRYRRKHTNDTALFGRHHMETCSHCQKVERQSDSLGALVIIAASTGLGVSAALRWAQLDDKDLRPFLQKLRLDSILS
jgi:hypothetical protein